MPAVQGSAPAGGGGGGGGLDAAAVQVIVDDSISDVVAGAPGALNTLDELAAGFGDDPNFAAAVTTALAGKQGTSAALTDLIARWVPASAAGPASLDFLEDADNGTNKGTLKAPASMAGDRMWTLPDATVTLLGLSETAVKTGNYTAAPGEIVRFDTSGGAAALMFPTAPHDGAIVGAKLTTAGNTLTLTLGGSDVFNKVGGTASGSLQYLNQAILCVYRAADAVWIVIADDLPKSVLDTLYAPKATTVGTALGTTGTVDLDLAALDGTIQWIVATGNITFTTSNRAAGRGVRVFVDAGASGRTLGYPAGWIAHGAALDTALASGKRMALSILSLGTTDANISAVTSEQP